MYQAEHKLNVDDKAFFMHKNKVQEATVQEVSIGIKKETGFPKQTKDGIIKYVVYHLKYPNKNNGYRDEVETVSEEYVFDSKSKLLDSL